MVASEIISLALRLDLSVVGTGKDESKVSHSAPRSGTYNSPASPCRTVAGGAVTSPCRACRVGFTWWLRAGRPAGRSGWLDRSSAGQGVEVVTTDWGSASRGGCGWSSRAPARRPLRFGAGETGRAWSFFAGSCPLRSFRCAAAGCGAVATGVNPERVCDDLMIYG